MELRHLRYFVAVAEELSFSRAAQRLHISQPPLSQQIRQLEEELGVQLLQRTTRTTTLTAAGKAFATHARHVLAEVQRATVLATRTAGGEVGQLRLGFFSPLALIVADLVKEYRRRHPDVQILLPQVMPLNEDQILALNENRLDIAFLRLPIQSDTNGLTIETVLTEPMIVSLAEGDPLATRRSIPVQMLRDRQYVLFPRRLHPGYYDAVVGWFHRAGLRPNLVYEPVDIYSRLALVSVGVGIALSLAPISDFHVRGVVFRALQPPVPYGLTAVGYRADDPSPLVKEFLQVVRKVASAHMHRWRVELGAVPSRSAHHRLA